MAIIIINELCTIYLKVADLEEENNILETRCLTLKNIKEDDKWFLCFIRFPTVDWLQYLAQRDYWCESTVSRIFTTWINLLFMSWSNVKSLDTVIVVIRQNYFQNFMIEKSLLILLMAQTVLHSNLYLQKQISKFILNTRITQHLSFWSTQYIYCYCLCILSLGWEIF